MLLSFQTDKTLKCHHMQHFIWVLTFCQSTCLSVFRIKRVNIYLYSLGIQLTVHLEMLGVTISVYDKIFVFTSKLFTLIMIKRIAHFIEFNLWRISDIMHSRASLYNYLLVWASKTTLTMLCPWAKLFSTLVQHRKTCPHMTENLLSGR